MQGIINRLRKLEQVSGVNADLVEVTLINGESQKMLWTDALMLVLSDEVSSVTGESELAGLCEIMMH